MGVGAWRPQRAAEPRGPDADPRRQPLRRQADGHHDHEDGDVWFTEANPGNPGYRIAKALPAGTSGGYQEYLLPCVEGASPCSGSNTGTGPVSIAAAPDGTIWYTNELNNSVGHLDLENRRFTEYPLATIDPALAGGQPRAIRLAPDGTLWVAEFGFISRPGANAIIRIVPGETPTADVYKTGAGKSPLGVAPDTKGNVWFTLTPTPARPRSAASPA